MNQKRVGRFGEQVAAEFLRKKGYRITGMNYACRFGEIDIIAEDARYVAFVEVKLRKDARFAQGREFVTRAKQQRILRTAGLWIAAHPTKKQPRFDVIEIYGTQDRIETINHIEDAFWA